MNYNVAELIENKKGEGMSVAYLTSREAIKQEVTELYSSDMNTIFVCREQSEYRQYDNDVGEERLPGEVIIKDEISIREEDVKVTMLNRKDVCKSEMTEDFEKSNFSQYEDIGDESLSRAVILKDEISVKEEDLKMPVLNWVDLCKSEITENFENSKDAKPSINTKSTHDLKTYKCFCTYQTKHKSHLSEHVIRVHNNGVHDKCTKCSYKAKCKSDLARHISGKHDKDTFIHKCTHCAYATKYKSHLTRHTKLHEKNIVVHKCTYCAYETQYEYILKKHFADWHDENPVIYKCVHCPYQTTYKPYLTTHVSRLHGKNAAVIKCALCAYETKCKYTLAKHINRWHDKNPMVFKCTHCAYETKYRSNLARHKKREHMKNAVTFKTAKCALQMEYKQVLKDTIDCNTVKT